MLDLVHPALYCLELGASRVVPPAEQRAPSGPLPADPWETFASAGSISGTKQPPPPPNIYSSFAPSRGSERGLAWLPSEFCLSAGGSECAVHSYINNLHPRQHPQLYAAIVFNKIPKGGEPGTKGEWDYTIRLNYTLFAMHGPHLDTASTTAKPITPGWLCVLPSLPLATSSLSLPFGRIPVWLVLRCARVICTGMARYR